MADTPEGKVKKSISKILKSYGSDISYFMPAMGAFGKSGVSDFVCCIFGRFVAIEAKSDQTTNPPTELQKLYLDGVNKAGGIDLVIDKHNIDVVTDVIEVIKSGDP